MQRGVAVDLTGVWAWRVQARGEQLPPLQRSHRGLRGGHEHHLQPPRQLRPIYALRLPTAAGYRFLSMGYLEPIYSNEIVRA